MGNEASDSSTKNTYPTQGMPVPTSENLPVATPASLEAIYAQDAALARQLTDEDETSMRAWDEYHAETYRYGAWREQMPPPRPPPPVIIHEQDPEDIVVVWCLLIWLFFFFAFLFFLSYY